MKKRFTAMLLMLCLILGTVLSAAPALAETFTVYVVSNTLPVYSKVSASSSVLGTMSYGEHMTCVAYNDTWAAVKNNNGRLGYCKISGLSVKNPNTLKKTAYITAANTPVYRKPSTGADVMMKLPLNSSYTAVAMTADGSWVRLQNGKYYGYVQTKFVSASAQDAEEEAPGLTPELPAIPESANTPVYVIANTLPVYQSATSSSKKLGTMSYGEAMTMVAVSGEWARVRNTAGALGFCKLSGISTANPNTYTHKVYINTSGVKVYRKPTTSAGVMMTLARNSSYICVAVTSDGSWLRLQNGKYYGYIQSQYASNLEAEDPVTQEQTVFVANNTLPVYKEASETSGKLGTMSYGESMIMLSVDDGWANVRNAAGDLGYCMYGGLTTQDPNTLNTTMYASDDVLLYAKPVSGAAAATMVNTNTPLTVIAITEDGEWARVNLNGSYVYAQLEQLSESKVAEDNSLIATIDPRTMYVSATNLTCYTENNTSSGTLATLSFGEAITCTGLGEGWARVICASGRVGYCKESGLTAANPNTYSKTLYAQSAGVKVYEKASTSSSVLMSLNLNTRVTGVAVSSDNSWIRLYNGSAYGYVQSEYFSTSQVQSTNSSTINKIVELAKKQLGIKYVYAAQSPSTGFDCSGFVYYVFKNAAGVTLKRTAYTQGYDSRYTKITSRKDLKVGDLVFFNTVSDGENDLCDHVGIYLGSNKFIHASSAKGEITISSMGSSNSDYYYRVYSWGRRILN